MGRSRAASGNDVRTTCFPPSPRLARSTSVRGDERQDQQDARVCVEGAPEAAAQRVLVVGRARGDPVPKQAGAAEHDGWEHDEQHTADVR